MEARAVRALLSVASGPYLLGLKANLALYDTGLMPRGKPALPTVSVGNITLGGTGKTTTTRHLARRLLQEGVIPGIVLRGHKRKRGPASLLVSDGEPSPASVAEAGLPANLSPLALAKGDTLAKAGDEALMLARTTPGCAVALGKRREAVLRLLAQATHAQVAVLDDGFQYFRMQRTWDLVLLDVTFDLATARVFPAGYLREPMSHLSRATHLLLTHTNLAPRTEIETTVELSVLAVSAVGNPGSFAATLLGLQARVAEQVTFPDHHHYVASDWRHVREAARVHSPDCVVVTEKDAVKLPPVPTDLPPVLVLVVDLEITRGEAEWEALVASVKSVCDEDAAAQED
jgi:tetraacyldisaccharide 4'-kinase